MGRKTKRFTRKQLHRARLKAEAERQEEERAAKQLRFVPSKWRKQDREMSKMLEGVTW